jgi:NAD(P)-dependent dehydrogenase (short-subunit alcohol dehydrogenase family)
MSPPIVLITGSTDGIGKVTAMKLSSLGFTIILHGRNRQKGEKVREVLARYAQNNTPDLVIADLADQDQIGAMADDILSRYHRLDVLINNAGMYEKKWHLDKRGGEMTFSVNYLAPFALTHRLLPLLKKSAPSRIVTVASSAHEDVDRIYWDNLPRLERYDAWGAYSLSKFADITFTYTLARNIAGTGVTANCLHPGVTDTKLLHSAFPSYSGISPDEAARTSVYLASSPEVMDISGQYFETQKRTRSTPLTHDRSVQAHLWKIAEELTGSG